MTHELLTEKYNLVNSGQYKRVRELQIEHILKLSNGAADPVFIKGMIKLIYDTNEWENDFLRAKEQERK
jgi:hypothetical protein